MKSKIILILSIQSFQAIPFIADNSPYGEIKLTVTERQTAEPVEVPPKFISDSLMKMLITKGYASHHSLLGPEVKVEVDCGCNCSCCFGQRATNFM